MRRRLLSWLVPRLIYLVHYFLAFTIRWTFIGPRYEPKMSPFILSFWHARILMMPLAVRGWRGPMLISEHRDGSFIADAVRLMGIESARGSSKKGGARAFLEMVKLARHGNTLGITPDGPKGPREVVQMGTIKLARKSGLPIRSVCYATKRHWRANSWDRFYIPKPFTRGVFVIGEPVYADQDDDQENLRLFQRAMDDVQKQADSYFD
ncbi:MAG TPA: lysophospholipid acyltransferase family protein [Mariprofundaceae bacterium]|nr:lysophospholipid acyltransferase family protein [Mariprofundaceae bacterium]